MREWSGSLLLRLAMWMLEPYWVPYEDNKMSEKPNYRGMHRDDLEAKLFQLKEENAALKRENEDIHMLLNEAFAIYPYEDESGIKKITLNDYARIRNWMIESALLTAEE